MLNVHLGAPGIVTELLKSLSATGPVRAADDLYIAPPSEYRELFKQLVNAKPGTGLASPDALQSIREFTHLASILEVVALSHSNFFGYAADALVSRKAFPLAEARVGRFSSLIGSCPMTFHLVITSQIDYILRMRRMSSEDRLTAIRSARFSWSELVFRIRRGAPERNLIIWDFDRPKAIVLPFVEAMLGLEAIDIKQQVLEALSNEMTPIGSGPIDYSDDTLARAVARLDAAYERDLDEIERMEGVTLVRHETIPPDRHL